MERMVELYLCRASNPLSQEDRLLHWGKEYALHAGLSAPSGTILRDKKGKPFFSGLPFCFSVSHSGDLWGCAFSPSRLGLDLQREQPCASASIARRFFHPLERRYAESAPDQKAFFAVWTAKESYVKFTGEGITDAFSDFSVISANGAFSLPGVTLRHYPVREGYHLCLCTDTALPVSFIWK